MIENDNPYLSQMARRPTKADSVQAFQSLRVDGNHVKQLIQDLERRANVWNTSPKMDHYPRPVRWIATIVGKVVLYFSQVVTKPQQEFNLASVQTMSTLRDGLSALDHNLVQLNGGIAILAQNLQVVHDSLTENLQAVQGSLTQNLQGVEDSFTQNLRGVQDSLTENIRGAKESLKILASGLEAAASRQSQMEQRGVEVSSRVRSLEQLPARISTAEQILAGLAVLQPRVATLEEDARLIRAHADAIVQLRQAVGEARQHIAAQEQRTGKLLEEARKRLPKGFDKEQLQKFSEELEAMEDALYLAFEDKFRGSREEIKERVKVYLPTIREAGAGTEVGPVLDVGCGRGEWLELLKENKLQAYGIDSNKAMVKQCEAKGLRVTKSDVMLYLANVHDESLGAITGFHIIEHLPFNVWLKLLDEALRTLKKGGVAIFETPNPSNMLVGSNNFYLDPTHRNPLPSAMLKFMAEARGFTDVEILNLHPVKQEYLVRESTEVSRRFNECFYGPQDYAIIAWKG